MEFGEASRYSCQVVDFFDFTFTPEIIQYKTLSICDGDSIYLQGAWQHVSGIYHDTLVAASYNDSIFVTTLIVNPVYNVNENVVICLGETYTLPDGTEVNLEGTYLSNLATQAGCDSNIVTTLSVLSTYNITENVNICDG